MYSFQYGNYFNFWLYQNPVQEIGTLPNLLAGNNESIYTPTQKNKEKFKCDICSKTFESKHSLVSHKKNIHEQVFKVDCPKCGQSFANKYTLKKHSVKLHPAKVGIS